MRRPAAPPPSFLAQTGEERGCLVPPGRPPHRTARLCARPPPSQAHPRRPAPALARQVWARMALPMRRHASGGGGQWRGDWRVAAGEPRKRRGAARALRGSRGRAHWGLQANAACWLAGWAAGDSWSSRWCARPPPPPRGLPAACRPRDPIISAPHLHRAQAPLPVAASAQLTTAATMTLFSVPALLIMCDPPLPPPPPPLAAPACAAGPPACAARPPAARRALPLPATPARTLRLSVA